MFPRLSNDNAVDRVSVYPIFLRQVYLPRTVRGLFSDFKHLFSGKLASACHSFSLRVTTLCDCIKSVVVMGSKEKVIGIYARWVVAPVADTHSFWNWPIVNLPRNSVGADSFHFPMLSVWVKIHRAVSLGVFASNKNPASISLLGVFQKPLFEWNLLTFPHQLVSALKRTAFLLVFFGVEKLPAVGTLESNHTKRTLSMVYESIKPLGALNFFNRIQNPEATKGNFACL